MRKLVIGLLSLVLVVLAADFGVATYGEYRLSRQFRADAALSADPEVAFRGFPFLTQLAAGEYRDIEVRATRVPNTSVGAVTVEANLRHTHLGFGALTSGSADGIPVDRLEARMRIGSTELGQALGIPDLEFSAPAADPSDGAGGTGGSGVITPGALILSGTPAGSPTVSVRARLTLVANEVHLVADELSFGPGSRTTVVPADVPAVLGAFSRDISTADLPFAVYPTRVYSEGQQIIVVGSRNEATVTPGALRPR